MPPGCEFGSGDARVASALKKMLDGKGTFVIATSVVMDAFAQARVKQEGFGYIGDNPLINDVQPPHYVEAHNNGGMEATLSRYTTITQAIYRDIMTTDEMRDITVRSTKTLIDNGVLVGLGTDSIYPGVCFGEAMHREMEIWVDASFRF